MEPTRDVVEAIAVRACPPSAAHLRANDKMPVDNASHSRCPGRLGYGWTVPREVGHTRACKVLGRDASDKSGKQETMGCTHSCVGPAMDAIIVTSSEASRAGRERERGELQCIDRPRRRWWETRRTGRRGAQRRCMCRRCVRERQPRP